jgi:hypothetical protein
MSKQPLVEVFGFPVEDVSDEAKITQLAEEFGFETRRVAVRNNHHAEMNELLIGKDLSWCAEGVSNERGKR